MKRLVARRMGLLLGAALLATTSAAACAAPPKPKIAWNIAGLLPPPGPGVIAGTSPHFRYVTSGLPAGTSTFLQKASVSGISVKWRTLSQLENGKTGFGTIIRPPLGRNAYRVAVVDRKGKLLTYAIRNLDVYREFSFADITNRTVQTVKDPLGGDFPYVFQAVILLEHTSCRSLQRVALLNKGAQTRTVEISHTIGSKTKATSLSIGPISSIVYFAKATVSPATPGEDLQIQVVDNNKFGSTVYGNGNATCFTDTGQF